MGFLPDKEYTKIDKETGLNILHLNVLNEYFANGFNASQAVRDVTGNDNTPGSLASLILKDPKNQAYIAQKKQEMRATTGVELPMIVRELHSIAMADVTVYAGLSLDEIKALPVEIRRLLKDLQIEERKEVNRAGNSVKITKIKYSLHDKAKAIETLLKYHGAFDLHNKQKGTQINIQNNLHKYSTDQLKNLEAAIKAIEANEGPDNEF